MRCGSIILTAALLIGLGACSPAYRGVTSGSSVSREGPAQSGVDSCVQSCDSAHARCMDSSAAQRVSQSDDVTSVFGAGAECDTELKSCLPKCQAR
ncbi:MAG: hypothetical protein WDO70_05895 [Alphaproteobacteria bacterium]